MQNKNKKRAEAQGTGKRGSRRYVGHRLILSQDVNNKGEIIKCREREGNETSQKRQKQSEISVTKFACVCVCACVYVYVHVRVWCDVI